MMIDEKCEKLADIGSCHLCIDRREHGETCVYGFTQVFRVVVKT